MKTFKMTGIYSKNHGKELEKKIKEAFPGEEITMDYDKNTLKVGDRVDLDDLASFLDRDKVLLVEERRGHDEKEPGHHHHHDISTPGRMVVVFLLNLAFAIAEFIFGTIFKSSAILADGLHDLGDSLSIGLAYLFEKISNREADQSFTFGYSRFSLLGAVVTSTVLIFGSILIILRSVPKLFNPVAPSYKGMFWMAIIAILVNGFSVWLLNSGSSSNERVLSIHVLEDLLGWVAVLVVSIVLRFKPLYFLDPLLSLVIAAFILYSIIPEFVKAIKSLLNSAPEEVPSREIKEGIQELDGVIDVSHFHVWSIDGKSNAFMVTVFTDKRDVYQLEEVRKKVRDLISPYNFSHYSIEVRPKL